MASLGRRIVNSRLWGAVASRAAIALLVVALLVALAPRLSFIEVRALDMLYALAPARGPDPRLAIVDIGDDPSVYEPFRDPRDSPTEGCKVPRRVYGEAARRLKRWGAKVIVFDLMFRRRCPYEDEALAQAFRDAGNVVVAASTKTKPGATGLDAPVSPINEAVWAVGSPAAYQPNATVRSIPLLVRDHDTGREYLALSLLGFERAMGASPRDLELSEGRWLLAARRKVPLLPGEQVHLLSWGRAGDADESQRSAVAAVEVVRGDNLHVVPGLKTWNTLLVNWAGPRGTIPAHELSDVLALGDAEGRRLFGGKAVVVGDCSEWDFHFTAVGVMSGPEIQANALQTLISGAFIRPIPPWAMLALLAFFAAATAWIVRRFRGMRAIGAVLLLMVVAVVLARQLLVQWGIWMYLFYSLLGIALAWGMATVAESGKVSALLGRFVPSFIGKPEAPRLGEVRTLDVSILFSDIRGYTGTAEQLSAEDTLTLLDRYQSAVEEIIAKHGGTIVKTPGDAVLAVFWQGQGGLHHADCALQAGREVLASLPALAQAWHEAGLELEIGIGINAGPAAMGLVGKRHLEPTVIGDTVNVAQRLETLTKTLGYPLIFSESVRARLRREVVEAVCLDEVTLRGRKTPIRVYGVADAAACHPPSQEAAHRAEEEGTE